ncbi:MAG: stage V sporulation protein AE [Eubacteriales bacterium]|nr:stage V sporulation protein AE [Eubacteriales bacterium]
MMFVKAFIVGGVICALTQILMDKTKMMPGRIMVLLVCLGTLLSAVGLYEPLVDYAGAGASVPLTGFGNVLWKGMKKAIDANGLLGIFLGGFQACAAGVSAAIIFGYIASWIFNPKMKKK